MNKKYLTLIKNTAIFAIGSIGSKLILFLLVPLYTNYMTTEEYGIADLVFTIGQIIVPFVSGGIFNAVIRFGISKEYKKENVLRNSYLIAAVGSFLMVAIAPIFNVFSSVAQWKWFLSLYVITDVYSSIGLNYLKAKERNRAYAVICLIRTVCLAVANIILLVCLKRGITGYLLSTIISCVISFALSVIMGNAVSDLRKSEKDNILLKEMLLYSAPLILNGVSWWIIHSSDKVMIELMIGTAALGVYSVAGKMPSVINLIVNVFSQAWDLSSIKEIEDSNETSFFSNVLELYSTTTFFVTIIVISITKPFMTIYVGEAFRECWVYVPLLLVSASYGAIGSFYGSFYAALKKSTLSMYSTLIAAIVNIGVNFALIPSFGIWGAVIGTLTSYIVISIYRMVTVQRILHIEMNLSLFIIDYLLVLIAAIVVSADYYIGIASIFLILIYVVLNRKCLFDIAKRISKTIKMVIGKAERIK